MSKVVRVHQWGGPEELRLEDEEVGEPGPGEVRLKVEAIGLNRSEVVFRAGGYPVMPELPTLIGYEGVGVIEAVGPDVSGLAVGERVCVLPNVRMGEYGLYAEHAIVRASSLIAPPSGLSIVEAASIWMQYFTALAIVHVTHATVGDFVVIRAASSSVGVAAIQLANWAGAVPIAATRRSTKAAALEQHGAKHVVATEEVDYLAEIQRITDGLGARIIFDPVGGPEVDKLAQSAANNGTVIVYGGLSGQDTPYPHWPAAFKGLSIRGWLASEIWNNPEHFTRYHKLILQGLAEGYLKPVIARTFPLVEIVDAHRFLESNRQVGKIVVTV